jgi:hypothetical protein
MIKMIARLFRKRSNATLEAATLDLIASTSAMLNR